jgi:hypothetical protein
MGQQQQALAGAGDTGVKNLAGQEAVVGVPGKYQKDIAEL